MFCRPPERLPKALQMPKVRLRVKTTAESAAAQAKISWKRASQLKKAHHRAVARATAEIKATMQRQAVAEVEAMSQLPYQGTQPVQPVVPDWIHNYVDQSHDLRLIGGAVYCAKCGGLSKQPTGQSKVSNNKTCDGIPPNPKPETLRALRRKLSQLAAGLWHPALAGPWPDLGGGTGPRQPYRLHHAQGIWHLIQNE